MSKSKSYNAKSLNVRLKHALAVFEPNKEVTPEAINEHMGDCHATAHVHRLRKAGHDIVTLRDRRKTKAYMLTAYAPSYNPEYETAPVGSLLN